MSSVARRRPPSRVVARRRRRRRRPTHRPHVHITRGLMHRSGPGQRTLRIERVGVSDRPCGGPFHTHMIHSRPRWSATSRRRVHGACDTQMNHRLEVILEGPYLVGTI